MHLVGHGLVCGLLLLLPSAAAGAFSATNAADEPLVATNEPDGEYKSCLTRQSYRQRNKPFYREEALLLSYSAPLRLMLARRRLAYTTVRLAMGTTKLEVTLDKVTYLSVAVAIFVFFFFFSLDVDLMPIHSLF
jgi:hypothetical protein